MVAESALWLGSRGLDGDAPRGFSVSVRGPSGLWAVTGESRRGLLISRGSPGALWWLSPPFCWSPWGISGPWQGVFGFLWALSISGEVLLHIREFVDTSPLTGGSSQVVGDTSGKISKEGL